MPAVLFGSIGTVAESSEQQRKAFNEAFEIHGLDWDWSAAEYAELLEGSGGEQRIAAYAKERGEEVDAAEIHATKSKLFQQGLADSDSAIRDGVAETIAAAKRDDFKLALVTTTSRENIEALAAAVRPQLDLGEFDLVVDKSEVETPKPDTAVYEYALDQLGEDRESCVAIENNVDGVRAAKDAGIACVAYPGEANAGHDFSAADERLDRLSLDRLRPLIAG